MNCPDLERKIIIANKWLRDATPRERQALNEQIKRAVVSLRNCLLRERLTKLRERYAMNNKGVGANDVHR